MQTTHGRAYLILVIGLLAGSLAAIFTRLAEKEGVPALAIAAGRLTLGALVLTPFVLRRYGAELRALQRRDILFAAVAGFWMALHFIFYMTGLEHTSVLVAVVLGATGPLWAALLDLAFLKSGLGKGVWLGIAIAFGGVVCIALAANKGGAQAGQNEIWGSFLAILAAITGALYLTIGRKVRERISVLPYIYLVFSCAALTTLAAVNLTRTPLTGYSAQGYLWIVMLTIFPQLISHSAFNYLVTVFSPTYIGLATQSLIGVSTIFAYFLFNEIPLPLQIIGSLAIIGGVVVATLGQQHKLTAAAPLSENTMPATTGD